MAMQGGQPKVVQMEGWHSLEHREGSHPARPTEPGQQMGEIQSWAGSPGREPGGSPSWDQDSWPLLGALGSWVPILVEQIGAQRANHSARARAAAPCVWTWMAPRRQDGKAVLHPPGRGRLVPERGGQAGSCDQRSKCSEPLGTARSRSRQPLPSMRGPLVRCESLTGRTLWRLGM